METKYNFVWGAHRRLGKDNCSFGTLISTGRSVSLCFGRALNDAAMSGSYRATKAAVFENEMCRRKTVN